jgi:hypothetical protein
MGLGAMGQKGNGIVMSFKLFEGSYSQSGQESFVLNMLGQISGGTYIEIGAYHSTDLSNTFLLESEFKWKGIAFEIDRKKSKEYNRSRSNICITADATSFDYLKCFEKYDIPKVIDYLQVDIEPAYQSLAALKLLPWNRFTFKTITFEHDLYSNPDNEKIQSEAFELLQSHGYHRMAKNVKSNGFPYEDWYCHRDFVQDSLKDLTLPSDTEWRIYFL